MCEEGCTEFYTQDVSNLTKLSAVAETLLRVADQLKDVDVAELLRRVQHLDDHVGGHDSFHAGQLDVTLAQITRSIGEVKNHCLLAIQKTKDDVLEEIGNAKSYCNSATASAVLDAETRIDGRTQYNGENTDKQIKRLEERLKALEDAFEREIL